MKHFNRAHVWGVIQKITKKVTKRKVIYVEAFIDCPHEKHGNVSVRANLWGHDLVTTFVKQYKVGYKVRLSGNIQQYQKDGYPITWAFNIYKTTTGAVEEKKAVFIIAGEVGSFNGNELDVIIRHDSKGKYPAKEETINIHVPPEMPIQFTEDFGKGKDIKVKGYIIREKEDVYGEAPPQRPGAHEIEYEGQKIEI